jgi:CheY-like chemotaxis protein
VEHVTDGEEALGCIFEPKSTPSLPRLILLDLNLGKMAGLHVLRRLKSDERTRGIPVVVLSASRLALEVIESYKLGVNSYVMKPADGKRFIEIVKALGQYWLTINETPTL